MNELQKGFLILRKTTFTPKRFCLATVSKYNNVERTGKGRRRTRLKLLKDKIRKRAEFIKERRRTKGSIKGQENN